MKTQTELHALLVMPEHDREELVRQLEACGADVLVAADCKQARRVLQSRPALHVVVTDLSLEDGNWWMVRDEVVRANLSAGFVVCLRQADGGVTDILEGGASHVLIAPYEREAVRRAVEAAAARSHTASRGLPY